MGSSSQSTDVPRATTRSGIHRHTREAAEVMRKSSVDPAVLMANRRLIVCKQKVPIGIIIDGTASMGEQAYTLRDKSYRITGQIRCQKYLDDFGINYCVIGDANPSRWGGLPDSAPIQMTEFETSNEGVKALTEQIWLEEGGGGHAKESYELGMYGYARCVEIPSQEIGYLFIMGDEGFYPTIKGEQLRKHFGVQEATSIPTADILKELKKRYRVFRFNVVTGNYRGLEDEIAQQWREAVGENFIDLSEQPEAVVDVMLGCIALTSGRRNLDTYDADLVEQGQTEMRREFVRETFRGIDWQLENPRN